jgi:protein involved in polysaccharide export with SLBB domain
MRKFAVYFLFLLFVCVQAFPQGVMTKEKLLELARSGGLSKLSASEIRDKLKELGISEDEAISMAKSRGIDLNKYLNASGYDSTKMLQQLAPQGTVPQSVTPQVITPQTPAPVIVTPPQAVPSTVPVDTSRRLAPDTTLVGKGAFGLDYFGYNLFKKIPSAFEPNEVGPVDPGYLVAPGDALMLSVWGQTEFQYELEIDKEGRVFIPNAGQVFVSGTPLNRLQEKLKNQLSKYYSGLTADPPTVFLDVTIAKLRPLRIFVMGELLQPGGYTISSYATVFNALYAVGGPGVKGSLRTVKVLRDNKVIANVDLYDYLLRGNQTSDVRLQNNDVVFIPPRGKTVSIRGEVLRPAFYELKDNEDLSTLIQFAGGLLPTAYIDKAQIDRIVPFDERKGGTIDHIVVDISLKNIIKKSGSKIALYDADDVEVLPILEEKKNYVTIDGPVWRPGRYELFKAPTLKALISVAEGLHPSIYLPVGHIVRENADLISTRIIPFNLGSIVNGTADDIRLEPRDSVFIYSKEVIEIKDKYVNLFGEVKKPGRYILHDNMTLADLILAAGGYTQEASILQAEVSRVRQEGMKGDTASIILHPPLPREFSKIAGQRFSDSVREISTTDFLLEHRDEITVFPNPEYKEQQNITVEGDITYPGTYAVSRKGERLSEILTRAGGPTKTSYFGGAEFIRNGKRFLVDFDEAYYKKNEQHDVLMIGGDKITIPTSPHTVFVNGEVNNPGMLSFVAGNSVSDYIDRAGGLTDSSNYAILIQPTGETKRVNFGFLRNDPEVPEGSTITVAKVPPPPPEGKGFDLSGTIKDTFAVLSSAATIIFLIYQVTK